MGPGSGSALRVLSSLPGRLRVHRPDWGGERPGQVEARVRQVHGVEAVGANPLTGNILVRFDPRAVGPAAILDAVQPGAVAPPEREEAPVASPLCGMALRGILGHACVDALWFGAGYLGRNFGLPLAGLGPLHLLLDLLVWGAAVASVTGPQAPARPGRPGARSR